MSAAAAPIHPLPLGLWWSNPWVDMGQVVARTSDLIRWTSDHSLFATADVVIVPLASAGHDLPQHRAHDEQVWVLWSQESIDNYPTLGAPEFVGQFDVTMTYRLDSDIPIPYFNSRFLDRLSPMLPLGERNTTLLCAWVSSSWDRCNRNDYLGALVKAMEVHSYGAVHRTRPPTEDRGAATKRQSLPQYRFTAAFENSMTVDYVTEKFFQPLLAGSVPVVRGAPNIADFAPSPNSYIDATRFADAQELADHLNAMSDDEYLQHHTWRHDGSIDRWRQQWARLEVYPLRRLAAMVPALRMGRQAALRAQQRIEQR